MTTESPPPRQSGGTGGPGTEPIPVPHGGAGSPGGSGPYGDPRSYGDPGSPGGFVPVEERGRTEISDRVLERIATRAVAEVDEIGGAAPRVLGMPLGRDTAGGAARVSAHADGRIAIVRMTLSVTYPAPIRQVAGRVREHVMTRVRELTGLDARQVDIDVASLVPPAERGRRVR